MPMPDRPHLALVEDNEDLRAELSSELEDQGYPIWGVDSAEAFYKQLHAEPADIVLVDLSLPGEDGQDLIHYLSNHSQRGIIVVTARSDAEQRRQGLLNGADHYLVKPIDMDELQVAITALWRRLRQRHEAPLPDATSPDRARVYWCLDSTGRQLQSSDGQQLLLTAKEGLLIRALLNSENRIISKEQLHEDIFGQACQHEHDTHRIEVISSRIRRKARTQGIALPIKAVFGQGLVFVNPPRES